MSRRVVPSRVLATEILHVVRRFLLRPASSRRRDSSAAFLGTRVYLSRECVGQQSSALQLLRRCSDEGWIALVESSRKGPAPGVHGVCDELTQARRLHCDYFVTLESSVLDARAEVIRDLQIRVLAPTEAVRMTAKATFYAYEWVNWTDPDCWVPEWDPADHLALLHAP